MKSKEGRERDFHLAVKSFGKKVLGKFVCTSWVDERFARGLNLGKYGGYVMSKAANIESKYTLDNPEAGSQTEMFLTDMDVENAMIFNYLADSCKDKDSSDEE